MFPGGVTVSMKEYVPGYGTAVNWAQPVVKVAQLPCWRAHVPEATVCGACAGVVAVMPTPAPPVSRYSAPPSARSQESMIWMVTAVVGPLAATPAPPLSTSARLQAPSAETTAIIWKRRWYAAMVISSLTVCGASTPRLCAHTTRVRGKTCASRRLAGAAAATLR